jgi:hypothetical protein
VFSPGREETCRGEVEAVLGPYKKKLASTLQKRGAEAPSEAAAEAEKIEESLGLHER